MQKERSVMMQMTIVVAGLLVMNIAVSAQEMKSPMHHVDSTNVEQQKAATADVYVCPMHSDVKSDKPGKCPQCKMAMVLEKKSK
jgi:hypothetical protein